MPRFSTTRAVRHAAADMFDLVADVERYPEFVPLCRELKVRKRIPEPEGVEILIADMTIAYKLIHETFASRVTLDRPNLQSILGKCRRYSLRQQSLLRFGSLYANSLANTSD
jgi:coenzyme Q-binding protein COQ10